MASYGVSVDARVNQTPDIDPQILEWLLDNRSSTIGGTIIPATSGTDGNSIGFVDQNNVEETAPHTLFFGNTSARRLLIGADSTLADMGNLRIYKIANADGSTGVSTAQATTIADTQAALR